MSLLDTGSVPGVDIYVSSNEIMISEKISIKRPKNCAVDAWETFWNRLCDSNQPLEEDGPVVVDLDE